MCVCVCVVFLLLCFVVVVVGGGGGGFVFWGEGGGRFVDPWQCVCVWGGGGRKKCSVIPMTLSRFCRLAGWWRVGG